MEKLKTFLVSVWFVGLTIVVAGLMIGLKEDMDIAKFYGIFLLWCGIPGGILLIIDGVQSSRYKKEQEEHNRKYVTEEIIEDDFFGRMRFEKDSYWNTLESTEIHFPPLGMDSPEKLTIRKWKEEDKERIFRNLREIYNHKEEIMEGIYSGLFETLNGEWEEPDEDGKPYTIEKLRQIVYIWHIRIDPRDYQRHFCVELECTTTTKDGFDLGGHAIFAIIDFDAKYLDFGMEG